MPIGASADAGVAAHDQLEGVERAAERRAERARRSRRRRRSRPSAAGRCGAGETRGRTTSRCRSPPAYSRPRGRPRRRPRSTTRSAAPRSCCRETTCARRAPRSPRSGRSGARCRNAAARALASPNRRPPMLGTSRAAIGSIALAADSRSPGPSWKNSSCSDETTPPMTVMTRPATAPTTAASTTVPASRARTQARRRRGTSSAWALIGAARISMVITNTATSADRIGRIPTAGTSSRGCRRRQGRRRGNGRDAGLATDFADDRGHKRAPGRARPAESEPALPSPECAA